MGWGHKPVGLVVAVLVSMSAITVAASAVEWDARYEGDVLPSAATPVWTVAGSGTTEILAGDFLRLVDPISWDINNHPIMMTNTSTFLYNDPTVAGENWSAQTGRAFTIEWRMKINAAAAGKTPSEGEIGIKLEYMGSPGNNDHVKFEWYYDVTGQRLVNNRYKSATPIFTHSGWSGDEGAESPRSIDAFPGIGLGEWHTYRVTSAVVGGSAYIRELWLDGNYVGRWTDDQVDSSDGAQLKMRANKDLSPSSEVEFDYMRWANEPDGRYLRPVPLAPQTLLLNQSFDEPAGGSQGWLGDYGTTAVNPPAPAVLDGPATWGFSNGDPGAAMTPQTWQTVAIQPGDTVTLNGYLYATSSGLTASVIATLHDGALDGPALGSITVDPTTAKTDGDWVHFTLSGVANSGHVTVSLDGNLTVAAWGQVSCIYAEGFTLTASSPCAVTPVLASVVPTTTNHDSDTAATITGANLLAVTAVNLIQPTSGVIIPGAITGQTDIELLVQFPTAGYPIGAYNVVAEAPSCLAQQILNGLTVVCRNPTTVTGTVPASVTPPSGLVNLALKGTNLDGLLTPGSSLTLVNGETVLKGTNLVMNGDDLMATFDFSGAPGGFYKLLIVRGDACPDPQAIHVPYMSSLGDNLLTNPGFETGAIAPWVGGSIRSGDYFGCTPHTGTYFTGRAGNGTKSEGTTEQAIVLAPGSYELTLTYWAWVWDILNNTEGLDSTVTGEIVVDEQVVASVKFSSLENVLSTWVPMSTQWSGFTPTGNIMVRMTVKADGAGGNGWGVAGLDDVVLAEAKNPACKIPWADADGDHDVDQVDFGIFQACLTPDQFGVPTLSDQCRCFDRSKDGRVDEQDLPDFLHCASGPTVEADPACE